MSKKSWDFIKEHKQTSTWKEKEQEGYACDIHCQYDRKDIIISNQTVIKRKKPHPT